MAHDVFISYSSKDKETADAICEFLEKEGIVCWMAPRNISPGAKYAASIIEAINKCRLVILVFSANANQSDDVGNEIDRASQKGKTIIPFRIDNTALSSYFEYYLSNSQWFDATTPPLEKHLQLLTKSIKESLSLTEGVEIVSTPPAPPPDIAKTTSKKPLKWIWASLLFVLGIIAATAYILLKPTVPAWGIVIGTDTSLCAANDELSKARAAGYKLVDIYLTKSGYRTVIAGDAGSRDDMLKQVQNNPKLNSRRFYVFDFNSECPKPVKTITTETCTDHYVNCNAQ